MRRLFEPATAPAWLKPVLTSLRAALGDIWDVPLRLKDYAGAELPAAADFAQGLVYDRTAVTVKWSDGTGWNSFQPADGQLSAIAALAPAADQIAYWTGATTAALTGFTAFGRSLADDADAAAGRTTLGLGTAATRNTGTSGTNVPLLDGANSWSGAQTFNAAATYSNAAGAGVNITGTKTVTAWTVGAGLQLEAGSGTLTDNFSAGGSTVANRYASRLGTPTLAATNAITVTNAATFQIGGAPGAGSNVVITNAYALLVGGGATHLGGALNVTGNCTFGDNIADTHAFTGNVTIMESTGNALILKDSADNGNSVLLTLDIQGADGNSVGSFSKSSALTGDVSITSVGGNLRLLASNALQATITTDGVNVESGNWYAVNGTQVVATRRTGWSADTGTASRAAQATYSGTAEAAYSQATIQALMDAVRDLSRTQKALKDDLIAHGLIGA